MSTKPKKDEEFESGMDKIHDVAFEDLERNFQDVLDDLKNDDHLSKFRQEYERLFRALQKSNQHEKILYKKAQELHSEIIQNSSKVESAVKLSKDDRVRIGSLNEEIERAWKMIEASNSKHHFSQKTINNLSLKIKSLNDQINVGLAVKEVKSKEIQGLLSEKAFLEDEILSREKDIKSVEVTKEALERQIRNEGLHSSAMNEKMEKMENKIRRFKSEINQIDNNISTSTGNLIDMKGKLENKVLEVRKINESLKDEISTLEQITNLIQKESLKTNQTIKLYDDWKKKVKLFEDQLDREREIEKNLQRIQKKALEELHEEKSTKRDFENKLDTEKKKLQKLILEKKKMKKRNATILEGYMGVCQKIQIVDGDKKRLLQKWGGDKKKIDQVDHEKNVVKFNVVKSKLKLTNQTQELKQSGKNKKNLEGKIYDLTKVISDKKKTLAILENEREVFCREAADAHKKYFLEIEKIKGKKIENRELQKRIQENQEKLQVQQQKYETIRIERNNFNRGLVEANEEIAFITRKFDVMNQQINQLSEEISISDRNLAKVRQDEKRNEEKLVKRNMDLTAINLVIKDLESKKIKKKQQIDKYNMLINEADQQRKFQRKKLQQVTSERDILGTQLIRRNDELALLYEKVKIHEKALRNGAMHLSTRKRDVKSLKLAIKELQRDLMLLKKEVGKIMKYQKKIQTEKEKIVAQKLKVKALSEELEDPSRIERWRKLKGKDISNKEMSKKIQNLQKRLILKTEDVMEKDFEIMEKNQMFEELKAILKKQQPSADLSSQLNKCQQNVRRQTTKMKTLSSELNMHIFLEKEQRYLIQKLNRETSELKKELYSLRRLKMI